MAGKKKRNKEEGGSGGAPLWIVTFSDLMSLLLTFFVLLLSFSSIQEVEFQKALGSLKGALGVLPKNDAIFTPIKTSFPRTSMMDRKMKYDKVAEELQKALNKIKAELQKKGLLKEGEDFDQMISIQSGKDGLVIRIASPMLYALGSADLKPIAFPILDEIINLVAPWPNSIRIEGHTDDLPIHTREFPDNWALSAQRALNVLRYFAQSGQIDPTRLVAMGYGEHQPLFPNTTPENRARNRRVEIYVEPPRERAMVSYSFKEDEK